MNIFFGEKNIFLFFQPNLLIVDLKGYDKIEHIHTHTYIRNYNKSCNVSANYHQDSCRLTVAGRPVSCKPLDSFFTPDWHDMIARLAASIRKWQKAAGEPGIPARAYSRLSPSLYLWQWLRVPGSESTVTLQSSSLLPAELREPWSSLAHSVFVRVSDIGSSLQLSGQISGLPPAAVLYTKTVITHLATIMIITC